MRIIHVITTIERGGAEKQLLILVREQIKAGNHVEVFYLKGKPELRGEFETSGAYVDGTRNTLLSIIKLAIHSLRWNSPDTIIHAHLPAAELVSALLKRKIALVVSRHNTQRFLDSNPRLSMKLAKYVESRAAMCIAISRSVATFLQQTGEWQNIGTLKTVLYGSDISLRNTSVSLKSKEFLNFLFVGRLVPQKDLPTLLQAFFEHLKNYPQDKLTIVGEGQMRSELHLLAEKIGLRKNIFWAGKVSNLNSYYAQHDVFVLTSKYEGFGLVLLEALSNSLPILATRSSAIPEVLGADHSGLFPIGDSRALSELMGKVHDLGFRNTLLSEQMGRLALFDPQKMSSDIDGIYLESLKKA